MNKVHWKSFIVFFILGVIFTMCFLAMFSSIGITLEPTETIVTHQPKPLGWPDNYNIFIAIRQVESNGDDRAIGDGGRSLGPYQISRAYWQDANEHLERRGRRTYDYDTLVWDSLTSEIIMSAYWDRYGAKTLEDKARMHNGGPRGHLRDSTLVYWERVQRVLEGLK